MTVCTDVSVLSDLTAICLGVVFFAGFFVFVFFGLEFIEFLGSVSFQFSSNLEIFVPYFLKSLFSLFPFSLLRAPVTGILGRFKLSHGSLVFF